MKNDLIALIVATSAFIFSGIITYKLLNRRHTSGSFRELYEDNASALKGGAADD